MKPGRLAELFTALNLNQVQEAIHSRCYLADDVGVSELKRYRRLDQSLTLTWCHGIPYHTDDIGFKYSSALVLYNPGYEFRARDQKQRHEKKFFMFDLTKMHGLFWARGPVRKSIRKNWVALMIDSKKKPVAYTEFEQHILDYLKKSK